MWGKVTRVLAIVVLAVAAMAGTATRADAAFIAAICNSADCSGTAGSDYMMVTDEGAGDLAGGVSGAISMIFATGGLEFIVNTSQSKPALSDGMDLTFTVTNIAGGGGTVWLYAADTGFAGPGSLSGDIGGTTAADSTVTAFMCGGTDNSGPSPINSGCLSSAVFGGGSAGAFSGTFGPLLATANPYSLAIGVAISVPNAGTTTTGNLAVTSPEPATIGLFGLALLGLGGALRRRLPA